MSDLRAGRDGTTLPGSPFIHGAARRNTMLACRCDLCSEGLRRVRSIENGRRNGAGANGSCIVTLRRRSDDVKLTLTAYGDTVAEALATVVDGLDANLFQLLCVSTPRTIINDLHAPPALHAPPLGAGVAARAHVALEAWPARPAGHRRPSRQRGRWSVR